MWYLVIFLKLGYAGAPVSIPQESVAACNQNAAYAMQRDYVKTAFCIPGAKP